MTGLDEDLSAYPYEKVFGQSALADEGSCIVVRTFDHGTVYIGAHHPRVEGGELVVGVVVSPERADEIAVGIIAAAQIARDKR